MNKGAMGFQIIAGILLGLFILSSLFLYAISSGSKTSGQASQIYDLVRKGLGEQLNCAQDTTGTIACFGPRTDNEPSSVTWDGCPQENPEYPYHVPIGGCDIKEELRCCSKVAYENTCEHEDISICVSIKCTQDCKDGRPCDGRIGLGSEDTFDYVSGEGLTEGHECIDGCEECRSLTGDAESILACPETYPFRRGELDETCGEGEFCCQN